MRRHYVLICILDGVAQPISQRRIIILVQHELLGIEMRLIVYRH